MSIDYFVLPFDPNNKDFREWLNSKGVNFPDVKGRFPTLDELLDVLNTYNGLEVNVDKSATITISLGDPEEPGFALLLGDISTDGYYNFSFWGWRNQPITMVGILKKLSIFCGPLVLIGDGDHPILISQDTNIDFAVQEWNRRSRNFHPE